MFNAFGEGYLCLLKRFLFLSIHRLYFIQFLHEIYMEKVLQELPWPFFGHPYQSNRIKIHIDATLQKNYSNQIETLHMYKIIYSMFVSIL